MNSKEIILVTNSNDLVEESQNASLKLLLYSTLLQSVTHESWNLKINIGDIKHMTKNTIGLFYEELKLNVIK